MKSGHLPVEGSWDSFIWPIAYDKVNDWTGESF